jgi:hypothetical protein
MPLWGFGQLLNAVLCIVLHRTFEIRAALVEIFERSSAAMGSRRDHGFPATPRTARPNMDAKAPPPNRHGTPQHRLDPCGRPHAGLRTARQEVALHVSRRHETTRAVKVIPSLLPSSVSSWPSCDGRGRHARSRQPLELSSAQTRPDCTTRTSRRWYPRQRATNPISIDHQRSRCQMDMLDLKHPPHGCRDVGAGRALHWHPTRPRRAPIGRRQGL